MKTFEFEATGTKWEISLPASFDSVSLEKNIYDLVSDFENTYSRFKDSSFISKLSKNTGTFTLPKNAKKLFDIYQDVTRLTNGAFTPLIGKTLTEAGYDKSYSFKDSNLSVIDNWDDVISYDFPNINIKKPVQLDFGAGGKGYIIDLVGELIEDSGINEYCVDAGHDIRCRGLKTLKVGLEHPADVSKIIGSVNITSKSICGSSGNRRNWGNFHHIIHGNELKSPTEIIATWVIAESTLLADVASTAIFFVKPEVLVEKYSFEYLILNSDYTITKSENFEAEIYYA